MKYYLITLGCQMNKNDSERIGAILDACGFEEALDETGADIIIFNTCSVRQSAEERIYGKMVDIKKYRLVRPHLIVGVTGCMPGRDKKREFHRRMPDVDLYFPTHEMVNLPRWVSELRPEWSLSGNQVDDYLKVYPLRQPSSQAYLTIQTGCNKFCSYCVVPYARGLERNRPVKDILDEARRLINSGVIEITLLGQTVNSFVASDPENFSVQNPYHDHYAALLWEMNQLSGLERLHWTAAHPNSMSDEVIDALTLPKQVNYLHLPVQSGSDEVLFRMNRKYTREKFLEIIEKVKARRPGIALGTDIIVGFPGETNEQFEETKSLFRVCDFDISYTAQYSPRSGTLSTKLYQDDVSKIEKARRWREMQNLMEETVGRKNQVYLGRDIRVLVDRFENGLAYGTTDELKFVMIEGANQISVGKIVNIKVTQAKMWQICGNLLS
ncbi:MAG: tRNA (N6-isopentenyl adenosine(37)-C2)-methylthiotransferase MiaB [Patescibacteria group bacterium]